MKILKPKQIIVALDFDSIKEASSIVKHLDPEIYRLKIGKQLFASEGPKVLDEFNKQGFDLFLDLKLHDIPNTVYKALKNLLNQDVWMTNIHLLGGEEMIQAAREAREHSKSKALLIGVTVLTSLDGNNIKNMGFESLVRYRNQILVIFEANGKNVYPEPKIVSYNRSLTKSKLLEFENLEYRLTDATKVDNKSRFWALKSIC